MIGKYARMTELLDHLKRKYNINICIKDYVGFIPINPELDRALNAYLAHVNPYCMFVKKDRSRYYRCLYGMRRSYDKCGKKPEGFWGLCFAGLYEYIAPVLLKDFVIGSINIGAFPGKERQGEYVMEKLFRTADPDEREQARTLFFRHNNTVLMPIEDLKPIILLLAEYLAETYKEFISSSVKIGGYSLPRENSEDIIISHAIEYIRQNYNMKIVVPDIAKTCHCSESYINHVFGRRTGVSVSTYINKIRVERSKTSLLSSNVSIADIAIQVGYANPNYFNRVFRELVGVTPGEFRRRYNCQ